MPAERQYTDRVRTFAYGTDASFYRLNPKMVVKARTSLGTVVAAPFRMHALVGNPLGCWRGTN